MHFLRFTWCCCSTPFPHLFYKCSHLYLSIDHLATYLLSSPRLSLSSVLCTIFLYLLRENSLCAFILRLACVSQVRRLFYVMPALLPMSEINTDETVLHEGPFIFLFRPSQLRSSCKVVLSFLTTALPCPPIPCIGDAHLNHLVATVNSVSTVSSALPVTQQFREGT